VDSRGVRELLRKSVVEDYWGKTAGQDYVIGTHRDIRNGAGTPDGEARRLTTGLNAMSIDVSNDGKSLVYSVFNAKANIWAARIPDKGVVQAGEVRPVTNGNQAIEGMSISRDGQWLAFDSNRSGNQDIFKLRRTGGNMEQLNSDPADDFEPAWSPDGKRIAFHTFRTGNRDVFVMSQDGASIQQITKNPSQDRYPDWSPDGNQIVFDSDKTGPRELYVVSQTAGGTWDEPRQLTSDGGTVPKWSPDGQLIAYVQQRVDALRVVSPQGGPPRTLVSKTESILPVFAAWSPDSQTIYFKANRQDGGAGIWSVSRNGGAPRLLIQFTDASRASGRPEFATDGKELFFTITERESDVWVLDLTN
jgi:Tol biopolymer transport system component